MNIRLLAGFVGLSATLLLGTVAAPRAQENVRYKYDPLDRLRSVCFVEAGTLITYAYDAAGNRSSVVTENTTCDGTNQPPDAVDDSRTGSYQLFETVEVNVLANDSDPDGDPLLITDAFCTSDGCLVGIDGETLLITGTTGGSKQVIYHISDHYGGEDSAAVWLDSFESGGSDCCLF